MFQVPTGVCFRRARIERRTITTDSMGTFTESWSFVDDAPCRVSELTAVEAARYARDSVSATHRIYLDKNVSVVEADRVKVAGETYDVTGVLNPGHGDSRRVLIVEHVR